MARERKIERKNTNPEKIGSRQIKIANMMLSRCKVLEAKAAQPGGLNAAEKTELKAKKLSLANNFERLLAKTENGATSKGITKYEVAMGLVAAAAVYELGANQEHVVEGMGKGADWIHNHGELSAIIFLALLVAILGAALGHVLTKKPEEPALTDDQAKGMILNEKGAEVDYTPELGARMTNG